MLDLFSGIGGFALAASWVWGDKHEIIGFCEIDKFCQRILKKWFPDVPIIDTIQEAAKKQFTVELVCGGDPCPIRSKARSNGISKYPDLSGYFLAVCGQSRPRWILRENVPASDDVDFTAALEALGYRSLVVRTDAASITGQQRIRDIIIASTIKTSWESKFLELYKPKSNKGNYTPGLKENQVIACFTAHGKRYDSRDNFIWESPGKLRILDSDERIAFSGFPGDWLTGLSETRISILTGNTIVPQVAAVIMQTIKFIDEERDKP